jgi:serine/threonine-protein kinase SRPK3
MFLQKLVDPRWISEQIMIIDFGIAFLQEQSSEDIGTPKVYCAPEFNFGCPRSISSDTWALGCTIFEIRTGACLFRYRGVPTRDQVLVSMVQLLGKLPEKWWKEWEDGHNWYDIEIQVGGDMAGSVEGSLHHQIMQIGMHDGDAAPDPSLYKNHDLKHEVVIESEDESEKASTAGQAYRDSTNRLVALVEELTTSEAADVIDQINKSPSSGSSHDKSTSESANKNNSGSGVTSSSSAPKSGDKSISSEGISTGLPASSFDTPAEKGTSHPSPESLPAPFTVGIAEFLEATGTTISLMEADSLESLLREALIFLPEERVTPLELAKHHWFHGEYKSTMQERELLVAGLHE